MNRLTGETPIDPDNLCRWCDGACCRQDTQMDLTDSEAESLRSAGTELTPSVFYLLPQLRELEGRLPYEEIRQLGVKFFEDTLTVASLDPSLVETLHDSIAFIEKGKDDKQSYVLINDCGYLDTSVCPPACTVVDDDSKRPGICQGFKSGGETCLKMRERGVVNGLSIILKPGVDRN